MRRPSVRCRPGTVTVTTIATANVAGEAVETDTDVEVSGVAVHPMAAVDRERHGLDASETGYTVRGFLSDPGVDEGDLITWGSIVLSVLGPASDQAGRGSTWSVACKART